MENDYYIKKWLEGTLTADERKVFEASDEYLALENFSQSLIGFKAPEYDVEGELERFNAKKPSKGKVVKLTWVKPLLKVAAVFLVLFGAYFYFLANSTISFKTTAAEKTELFLPDSSRVILNALSEISYDKYNWKDERSVELKGEAYFEVAKGSKFEVHTSSGTVSVLGTEFNVKDRTDYFEVICYGGLVQVKTSKEAVKLPAKHMFRLINETIAKRSQIRQDSPGWIAEESFFQSVPFLQVVEEFERQYNVSIIMNDVNTNQFFTGSFTHANMSLALKSIAYPLNLKYQITEDQQIILSGDFE